MSSTLHENKSRVYLARLADKKTQRCAGADPEIIEGGGIFRPRSQNVGHTPLDRRSLMQIVHDSSRITAENAQTAIFGLRYQVNNGIANS